MKTLRKPTNDNITALNKILGSDPRKRIRQRAKILFLSLNKLTCREIAATITCDKNTVSSVKKIWNENGFAGIITYRQTNSWMKQIKRRRAVEKLVTTSPKSLNLAFNTWSLKKLSVFFRDLVNFSVSPSTLYQDLKVLKISYKQIQDAFIFTPVDYEIKRAYLRFLERYCPPSWRLIYLDEKGPIYAMRYSGHTWSFNRQFREVRQSVKQKINFLGGYDPKTKKLEMVPMEGNASTYFCDAFDQIRLEFLTKKYTKLLVIMDNARIHTSRETIQYLNDDPRIEYFFLPAYSPELNPIEICFRNYKSELLDNANFISRDEVINATTTYCQYYQTLRTEIYG